MIVVSDTSPVMNLAIIGQLQLLERLYGVVSIPEGVAEELKVLAQYHEELQGVLQQDWLKICRVSNSLAVQTLILELDQGEAEAIVLAQEKRADLLLMDEKRGRKIAQQLGIKVLGVVGVLLQAKEQKLTDAVKPHLNELITRAGFWVGEELYRRVLEVAGET